MQRPPGSPGWFIFWGGECVCFPNRACTDGSSRYCPRSLDLTNFGVRSRGATAEPCAGHLWLTALNLEIQESGNSGIWKSGNRESQKIKNMKILRMQICSAQNVGKVYCRLLVGKKHPLELRRGPRQGRLRGALCVIWPHTVSPVGAGGGPTMSSLRRLPVLQLAHR